ncbi:MAG: hypothetical protein P4L55_11805 [Syntrophobacteraceae bacterium]|nr:hypothetical protein [Syntrophobacteraceae bacterium]
MEKPAVYYSLGHPLIAMFEDKLESRLVETAGGRLVNGLLERDYRPGITISKEQFCKLSPDIIIVHGFTAWPVEDFMDYCHENGLDAPAVREGRIFHLHPYRASASPDWILGLLRLANILHPRIFHFDLRKEADDFHALSKGPIRSIRSETF